MHRILRTTLAITSLSLPLSVSAQTIPPAPRAVLVELFTSEGCSSCPPADRLLSQIANKHSSSGQLIIALSEHVTYWNRLGWTDPFSQDLFTQRQQAYGDHFRLESVYTPQMVVDGSSEVSGGDPAAVQRAVLKQDAPANIAIRIDSAVIKDQHLVVSYAVSGLAGSPAAEIYAVISDDMASSDVKRGENEGRKLAHVSVARSLTSVGKIAKSAIPSAQTQTITIPLPPRIAGQAATSQHVVLFAQIYGTGKILSVDTRSL